MRKKNKITTDLRVIKTARTERTINKAARNGFFPLVKKLEPSDAIQALYAVSQNEQTGEITVIGNFRCALFDSNEVSIIDFDYYYPYNFPSPFAAYLIPSDIIVGERVMLEDLIQDYIGGRWFGNTYRLESCEAIWDGKDFDIQYDPSQIEIVIG